MGQNADTGIPMNVDDPNMSDCDDSEECRQQLQAMKHMLRSKEASKQMLYTVFSNAVAILEEYEARTQAIPVKRSKLELPDQSHKTVKDVQSILKTQLLAFETMQMASPEEVNKSINKELRQKTIHWAAVRAEKNIPPSDTDTYICKLYEVLVKGETTHEFLQRPMQRVSAETLNENVQLIVKGQHVAMQMDRQFTNDETKKATSPPTRQSDEEDAFTNGAARMASIMGELKPHLDVDVRMFKKEGVLDNK